MNVTLFVLQRRTYYVMHMGKGNKKFKYDIGGVTLRASEEEKNPEVIMYIMKPSRYCVEAAQRANRTLKTGCGT